MDLDQDDRPGGGGSDVEDLATVSQRAFLRMMDVATQVDPRGDLLIGQQETPLATSGSRWCLVGKTDRTTVGQEQVDWPLGGDLPGKLGHIVIGHIVWLAVRFGPDAADSGNPDAQPITNLARRQERWPIIAITDLAEDLGVMVAENRQSWTTTDQPSQLRRDDLLVVAPITDTDQTVGLPAVEGEAYRFQVTMKVANGQNTHSQAHLGGSNEREEPSQPSAPRRETNNKPPARSADRDRLGHRHHLEERRGDRL